jgi:UDP-glucose 4-epimerase
MNKPDCVVTGGAGFIGSHLVEALLNEGCVVRCVDNLSTGQRKNVDLFQGRPGYSFHELDVNDLDRLKPVVSGANWVFHLAALADIVPSIEHPLVYHRANVDGTISVLEAARAANVRRFVYAASSSCYGIPDVYPTPETAPIRAEYPYALTKYVGEEYVLHWGRVYGLPVVSVRLLNVYGLRARTTGTYGAVFGVFLAQKLAGRPLTIVGDGTQTRDFTFVTDAVSALITAARHDVVNEVFNVGSGGTYAVNALAELVGGPVTHLPKRPGEPACTYADIRKIKARLGWEPKVRFEDGVKVVLEHIEDWRGAPVWTPESISKATASWFKYLGKPTQPGGGET